MVLTQGCALVYSHSDHSSDGAGGVTQCGSVERDVQLCAFLAAKQGVKAGNPAGRKAAQTFHVGGHAAGRGSLRLTLDAADFLDLRDQSRTLARSQDFKSGPLSHQLVGVVAEHAFRSGVDVREAAIQADGDYAWASRLE